MNSEMVFKHTTLLALGCLCPFAPRTQLRTHRGFTALIQCSHSSGQLSLFLLINRSLEKCKSVLNSPKNHIEETEELKAVSHNLVRLLNYEHFCGIPKVERLNLSGMCHIQPLSCCWDVSVLIFPCCIKDETESRQKTTERHTSAIICMRRL